MEQVERWIRWIRSEFLNDYMRLRLIHLCFKVDQELNRGVKAPSRPFRGLDELLDGFGVAKCARSRT